MKEEFKKLLAKIETKNSWGKLELKNIILEILLEEKEKPEYRGP
jgi:hypothetical protein